MKAHFTNQTTFFYSEGLFICATKKAILDLREGDSRIAQSLDYQHFMLIKCREKSPKSA